MLISALNTLTGFSIIVLAVIFSVYLGRMLFPNIEPPHEYAKFIAWFFVGLFAVVIVAFVLMVSYYLGHYLIPV